MKLLFFFFALLSIQQSVGQLSYSYSTKKTDLTDFMCEVKLNRTTQTVESCVITSVQKKKHQNDSMQTQILKEVNQLKSMSEVLQFFSANKWELLTTVSDCNASTVTMYYERTIIWGSTEEKKRITIPAKPKNEAHWLKNQ